MKVSAAVGEVLVGRHAAGARLAPRADAVAEHHVAVAAAQQSHQVRHQPRVVLVVGVDHHHDVGAARQRLAVAGLLVAAVAEVALVLDHREAEPAGERHGAVAAAVVHQDDLVHRAGRDVRDGPLERGLGVVGGHHGDGPARGVSLRHRRSCLRSGPCRRGGRRESTVSRSGTGRGSERALFPLAVRHAVYSSRSRGEDLPRRANRRPAWDPSGGCVFPGGFARYPRPRAARAPLPGPSAHGLAEARRGQAQQARPRHEQGQELRPQGGGAPRP